MSARKIMLNWSHGSQEEEEERPTKVSSLASMERSKKKEKRCRYVRPMTSVQAKYILCKCTAIQKLYPTQTESC